MTSKNIFILAGPTASGKTTTSFALCEKFPCEIISVDSALIYKGMDIGTAKPSIEEQKKHTHHLIDIISPVEHYSAASFIRDAIDKISSIQSQGKIPLLTGGTMLYYKALIEGLSSLPMRNDVIRKDIESRAIKEGWEALHNKLKKLDPISANKIKPQDSQRIQRALEVIQLTGKPFSKIINNKNHHAFSYKFISLIPDDRSTLHRNIETRFQSMLKNGFIDEVEELFKNKDLGLHLPSIRCVGYRQAWEYLSGEFSYETFVDKSIIATRQLAKRQLTWLRNWKSCDINHFNCLDKDVTNKVINFVSNNL